MAMMKATAVRVTQPTREFFKKLQFHDIPEDAQYIAFLEDGDAAFLEKIEVTGFAIPKMAVLSYYDDVEVDVDE